MRMQGYVGDTGGATLVNRRPNELIVTVDGWSRIDIDRYSPSAPDVFTSSVRPLRPSELAVSAHGWSLPPRSEIFVQHLETLARGVHVLRIAQRWGRFVAFGEPVPLRNGLDDPPERVGDGLVLFSVQGTAGGNSSCCVATAVLRDVPQVAWDLEIGNGANDLLPALAVADAAGAAGGLGGTGPT